MANESKFDKFWFKTLLGIFGGFVVALVIAVVGWFLIIYLGLANIIINITGVGL